MNPLKSLFLTHFFLFIIFGLQAQELHTPEEVEQYMKKSTIHYQMDSLYVVMDSISFPLLEKGIFLAENNDSIQIEKREVPFTRKTKRFYKKAQKAIAKNNFSKTIKFYKKAINVQPNHYKLINELASVYWENGFVEEVIFWATKNVETNPIDYEAHARLALAYQKLEKPEKALEHIVAAHLYNRNHPNVIKVLKSVFADNGMVYRNFTFQPEYRVQSKDAKTISIQANETPWQAYAACKALWQNDEKYKEQMSHLANTKIERIEQKECLLNALIAYEGMKTDKQNFPSLNILGSSLRNRMVDDFIFYEVSLRQNPNLIFSISDKKRKRIIRFLKTIRVNREVASE